MNNNPSDKERLILLEEYASDFEANIVRAKLESEGIPCMLTNEKFSSMYPLTMNTIGAIRLMIFEKDLDRARQILTSGTER